MSDMSITSKELLEKNPQALPTSPGELGRLNFWYYTRLQTADSILNGHSFWVSNLNRMNDLDELKLNRSKKEKIFALCLCNSNGEKIPMWYLYSGIAGTGASIGLTPSNLLAFLRSLETVVGHAEDGTKKILTIGRDKDVELRFGWVYYCKNKQPEQVFYRNKWYQLSDPEKFASGNYFIKDYPWEYEREFRVVFINRTKENFDRLIVSFPEQLRDRMKLRLGPELDDAGLRKLKKELQYIDRLPEEKLLHSELHIKMDLFTRNQTSLPAYLREEFAKAKSELKPEALCRLIQDVSRCEKAGSELSS